MSDNWPRPISAFASPTPDLLFIVFRRRPVAIEKALLVPVDLQYQHVVKWFQQAGFEWPLTDQHAPWK